MNKMTVVIAYRDLSKATFHVDGCAMDQIPGWVILYDDGGRHMTYINRDQITSVTIPEVPPQPTEEALPEKEAKEQE